MPPPPVTPSPHRFVVKKQAVIRRASPAHEYSSRPSTRQFNTTPRFSFPSNARRNDTQNAPEPTPSASQYLTSASKAPELQEAIESPSTDLFYEVQDSIEVDDDERDRQDLSAEADGDHGIDEPIQKRRRISSPMLLDADDERIQSGLITSSDDEETLSPPLNLPSPSAPRRPATTAPRFVLSAATPQSPPNQTTFLKPPRFRPPDPSHNPPTTDPLPDQFSPHRRGQKFISGGLAAEVRDWLVNIESAIPARAHKHKENEWNMRITIDETSGGGNTGMNLVSGRQVHDDGSKDIVDHLGTKKFILAGEGAAAGLQPGARPEKGSLIGIKAPLWEISLGVEKWAVAVDWKVLQ